MVIKVYISGLSGLKQVKKRQQRVKMILDSKKIEHMCIDITDPGREEEKKLLLENCLKNNETFPMTPQIFNESLYCGDFEAFDLANENDTLETFLKLQDYRRTSLKEDIQNGVKENVINGLILEKSDNQEIKETKEITNEHVPCSGDDVHSNAISNADDVSKTSETEKQPLDSEDHDFSDKESEKQDHDFSNKESEKQDHDFSDKESEKQEVQHKHLENDAISAEAAQSEKDKNVVLDSDAEENSNSEEGNTPHLVCDGEDSASRAENQSVHDVDQDDPSHQEESQSKLGISELSSEIHLEENHEQVHDDDASLKKENVSANELSSVDRKETVGVSSTEGLQQEMEDDKNTSGDTSKEINEPQMIIETPEGSTQDQLFFEKERIPSPQVEVDSDVVDEEVSGRMGKSSVSNPRTDIFQLEEENEPNAEESIKEEIGTLEAEEKITLPNESSEIDGDQSDERNASEQINASNVEELVSLPDATEIENSHDRTLDEEEVSDTGLPNAEEEIHMEDQLLIEKESIGSDTENAKVEVNLETKEDITTHYKQNPEIIENEPLESVSREEVLDGLDSEGKTDVQFNVGEIKLLDAETADAREEDSACESTEDTSTSDKLDVREQVDMPDALNSKEICVPDDETIAEDSDLAKAHDAVQTLDVKPDKLEEHYESLIEEESKNENSCPEQEDLSSLHLGKADSSKLDAFSLQNINSGVNKQDDALSDILSTESLDPLQVETLTDDMKNSQDISQENPSSTSKTEVSDNGLVIVETLHENQAEDVDRGVEQDDD